jgi:hypothetical protein
LDTHRLELAKVERAFIDGEEEGFAALYTRKGTGEMAALAETVHCYPTQAEVFQRIALGFKPAK